MVEPAMDQDNGPFGVLLKSCHLDAAARGIIQANGILPPAASHPDVPSAAKDPAAVKPQGPSVRGQNPAARSPNPGVTVPIIVSGRVNIVRPWGRRSDLRGRRRRRHRGGHGRARRRFLNSPRRRSLGGSRPQRGCGIRTLCRRRSDINRLLSRATARNHSGQDGQRPN